MFCSLTHCNVYLCLQVQPDPRQRGLFFLFYSYTIFSGGCALLALVAGDAAAALEARSEEDVKDDVMAVLRSIYRPQGKAVPEPLQVGGRNYYMRTCGKTKPLVEVIVTSRGKGESL